MASTGNVKKQGAYGKVPTHSHSKIDQLMRPKELMAIFKLLAFGGAKNMNRHLSEGGLSGFDKDQLDFCHKMLHKVSRSFAGVIAQLPNSNEYPLRVGVAVFYLALRALDTVEDDMNLAKFETFVLEEDRKGNNNDPRLEAKKRLLRTFHKRFRNQANKEQNLLSSQIGEADELVLLSRLDDLLAVFYGLPDTVRTVIADITEEMGNGMADYIGRDLKNGTEDVADYNQYCHIVAGTVGDGLTRLWAAFGMEDPTLIDQRDLWDNMGLFLQKTNITRDVYEDFVDGRAFWPQSIYTQYLPGADKIGMVAKKNLDVDGNGDLSLFLSPGNHENKMKCLNHMITDALELVPDVIAYLNRLRTPSVIRFCAVPQVMAIATLAECYDNPKVYTGVCKIRKGLAAEMLLDCCADTENLEELRIGYQRWLSMMAVQILNKIPAGDPSSSRTRLACARIISLTEVASTPQLATSKQLMYVFHLLNVSAGAIFVTVAAWWFFLSASGGNRAGELLDSKRMPRLDITLGENEKSTRLVMITLGFLSTAFLLAFAGFPFFLSLYKIKKQ